MKLVVHLVAVAVALAQPALAQMPPAPGQPTAMAPDGMTDGAALMVAMSKMSTDMANAPMTGNADQDFAAMMLPHHQGAIDMARFELAHGKDPAMLDLARAIVTAQEKEIGQMKAWQAAHPATP